MTTYSNPILDADWPDPDAIRVGDDYWMIASSFNRAPGLPVLHSRDLVSWEHVANALPQVPPVAHYALPRHGSGVWAPSLRHHDGRFVIVYPDPDHGIFVLTAEDPRGPWTEPWCVLPGRGLIDPCPLWDDDGRTYLVHGWAKSRAGVKNRLTVVEVDASLRRVVGQARTVVDGDALAGFGTLEGPKLYKRDGWYWIFAPAGGVSTGWQTAFRSRSIWGPYEHRIVLEQGATPVNGPHQGAWVDTPEGADWFLHFQDRDQFGRVVHLQPMRWDDDGWPRMGDPLVGDPRDATGATREGRGQAVVTHATPTGGGEPAEPVRSDDFSAPGLAPRWHWQANPDTSWYEAPGDGSLHLAAQPSPLGNLRDQGAVLCQQLPGQPSTWESVVGLTGQAPGTRAGVVVLGREYAWLGLERTAVGIDVVHRRWTPEVGEEDVSRETAPAAALVVRLEVDAAGDVTWSWGAPPGTGSGPEDPVELTSAPGPWRAVVGHWIGAEVGLFASAPTGAPLVPGDGGTFGPVRVAVAGKDA